MSQPEAVVVPRDLYYHEVSYVRNLEAVVSKARWARSLEKQAEAEEDVDKAWALQQQAEDAKRDLDTALQQSST